LHREEPGERLFRAKPVKANKDAQVRLEIDPTEDFSSSTAKAYSQPRSAKLILFAKNSPVDVACFLRRASAGMPAANITELTAAQPDLIRRRRFTAMATDERDLLELLKEELDFVEKGGYGRSVRTPWQSKSTFQDSLTCINYGYPYRAHPCNECHLLEFVSPEHRTEAVPCHFIPLNTDGETIEDLQLQDNEAKLERKVTDWLRARIKEIEDERAKHASSSNE